VALVEHGEVDDDAAEQAALERAEEQPRDDEAGQGLCKAQKRRDYAPRRDESRQVIAGLETLDDPIALLISLLCQSRDLWKKVA
jgi:hypothetical protein